MRQIIYSKLPPVKSRLTKEDIHQVPVIQLTENTLLQISLSSIKKFPVIDRPSDRVMMEIETKPGVVLRVEKNVLDRAIYVNDSIYNIYSNVFLQCKTCGKTWPYYELDGFITHNDHLFCCNNCKEEYLALRNKDKTKDES